MKSDSKFLKICKDLINECKMPFVATTEINMDEKPPDFFPPKMGLYEKAFRKCLNEGATVRTDKLGNKVTIPPGFTFKEGPDGFGVAIAPCAVPTVDRVGRMHSVGRGYTLKIGKNGKGVVVAQGDSTRETKEGQIELIKRLNKT
jgi:hypothetical protein